MVSAYSMMLFLVLILSERVGVVFGGSVFCSLARSMASSRWSWAVGWCVAVLISSAHWASKGCGIGNWSRMGLGWSGSHVGFVVEWGGGVIVVEVIVWSF